MFITLSIQTLTLLFNSFVYDENETWKIKNIYISWIIDAYSAITLTMTIM